jgi:hypothetical protein
MDTQRDKEHQKVEEMQAKMSLKNVHLFSVPVLKYLSHKCKIKIW